MILKSFWFQVMHAKIKSIHFNYHNISTTTLVIKATTLIQCDLIALVRL